VSRSAKRWCCGTIARIYSSADLDVEHLPRHRIKAVGDRALDANLVAQAATSASACSCCREINSGVTE